ncbi:nucleoside/nucleotide kinase family protein [uncultured Cohaesibacter sp.]|uniref:nucleoside/nucleotide kinase family protein n=1 Tax=uncultured Cohaesibacter sp. TaxID=1002546 RepID=UPI00292FF2D4|nr:nucleoside/nucleotide kinase family protein [uncultured Cohaesibacter sp.]
MPRNIDRLADLVTIASEAMKESGKRVFLAIAGAPGSGKSTTADALFNKLDQAYPGRIAILPMDGFHFDDAVLRQMERLPWKGAPDTFDVGGLRSILGRLREGSEANIAVPVFDRELEISRGSARLIASDVDLVIVEGNYLLLDQSPWKDLAPFFDLTVFVEVPEEELRCRLRQRWTRLGLSEREILHKLEGNDLPNGQLVMHGSRSADVIFNAHKHEQKQ